MYNSLSLAPIIVAYMGGKSSAVPGCNSAYLKPGYFLSNEPGYYKEGDFGVRLENVIEVVVADVPVIRRNIYILLRVFLKNYLLFYYFVLKIYSLRGANNF